MYKNYADYTEWEYSYEINQLIKEENPTATDEELKEIARITAVTDSAFKTDDKYKVPPPTSESDYFHQEFYAKTYASAANVKLIGQECAQHTECGSRCCPINDLKCKENIVMNEALNEYKYPECYEFEQEEIKENTMLSIVVSLSIVFVVIVVFQSPKLFRKITKYFQAKKGTAPVLSRAVSKSSTSS
eukprot:CAMPEP_0170496114 /NCGR_PEP_ID=MMETSP0208-20121228/20216_1 /TAXON_ID=197538 /ORGANISM="Strombidium inclinatum, Strain S3" /LENGTH=187 /DNA_ID=CAMNT_0010772565 /DNA_START=264 /DNA_END=824 /DNA_ORIENTATION=+